MVLGDFCLQQKTRTLSSRVLAESVLLPATWDAQKIHLNQARRKFSMAVRPDIEASVEAVDHHAWTMPYCGPPPDSGSSQGIDKAMSMEGFEWEVILDGFHAGAGLVSSSVANIRGHSSTHTLHKVTIFKL